MVKNISWWSLQGGGHSWELLDEEAKPLAITASLFTFYIVSDVIPLNRRCVPSVFAPFSKIKQSPGADIQFDLKHTVNYIL